MARYSDVIRNIPFFSTLNHDELLVVEEQLFRKEVAKNQIVLMEEDTPNYMYVVITGKVRVVHMSDTGKEHILAIHKRGEFFGEMGLLDGKTAPATVIAMEHSEIALLSKQKFDDLLTRNKSILLQIIAMLCERYRESLLMLKVLNFPHAEQRLCEVLKHLSRLYGVKDQRGTIINLKLTHRELADYASISRETVTRLLTKLVKENFIEVLDNRHILIKKECTCSN